MTADLLALLDHLDETRAAATPGEWRRDGTYVVRGCPQYDNAHFAPTGSADDAALIVAAVNALPRLTAVLRAALELAEQFEAEAEVREVRATTYPPSGPWAIEHNRLVVRADTLRRSATRLCYVLTTALEAQPRGES